MNWDQMKRQYYRPDGTYRDLIVEQVDSLGWERLLAFFNEQCPLEFSHRENDLDTTLDRIDPVIVERQWTLQDYVPLARLRPDGLKIDLYFFAPDELEATIDPRTMKNVTLHKALVALMEQMATLLDRPVRLSQENNRQKVYLEALPAEATAQP